MSPVFEFCALLSAKKNVIDGCRTEGYKWDWMEIFGQGYTKSNFGAVNWVETTEEKENTPKATSLHYD